MFRTFALRAVTIALIAIAGATPARAQQTPAIADLTLRDAGFAFRGCDGFSGVSRSGDGVLAPPRSIEALGRMRPAFQEALANCDIAIAVLQRDAPQYWVRRVNLLHARAIHRLIASDTQGALVDLQLADESVQERSDDYLRTQEINAKLIRGLALVMQGDAAGQALAMQAHLQRPYSVPATLAALMVVAPDGDPELLDALIRDLSRLSPQIAGAFSERLRNAKPNDLEEFFMMMLEPESAARRARGWESARSVATFDVAREIARSDCNIESGLGAFGAQQSNLISLCDFRFDTFANVQDRMTVVAARAALAQASPYFSIERRNDVEHWAIPQFSRVEVPSGTESRLTIRLWSVDCPRCFAAQTVVDELGALYPQPEPPANRQRRN